MRSSDFGSCIMNKIGNGVVVCCLNCSVKLCYWD